MKALILNDKVVDIAENEFEVASPLYWMDAPVGCDTTWKLVDSKLTAPDPDSEKTYAEKRMREYPDIGDQLDALYHAGVFPTDMAAKIKKVKDDNPKS
jgi:hypothetical protein